MNELLLDLFEYLSSVDLLRAFSGLNHRFDHLLITHFRNHALDLRSISKRDFDLLCQEHRASITAHIIGLRLSDDDDTPNQIEHFVSAFSRRRFVQSKSLTLYHLSSYKSIEQMVLQLNHLSPLTELQLIDCHMLFQRENFLAILNWIWRLPKFRLNHDQFIKLCRCSPNLRSLRVELDRLPHDAQFSSAFPLISSLQLVVSHLTEGTLNLLRSLPNLTHLILEGGEYDMDGHKWKEFILKFLPKLKIFRFMMFFSVPNKAEMTNFVDSYRTPFWLADRQWFIRCFWSLIRGKITMFCHTLPYPLYFYSHIFQQHRVHIESTCPDDGRYRSYTRVTRLLSFETASIASRSLQIRFPNICHLEVSLPLATHFWSTFPRFEQLTSLVVSSDSETSADLALSQLQQLLNRAPRLYRLTISQWNSSNIQQVPLSLTSKSLRRLDL